MSPLIDVHSLGTVAFTDGCGGAISTGSDLAEDGWWPWVVAVGGAALVAMGGAALVALGAIFFTPATGAGPDPASCPVLSCPAVPEQGAGLP